MEDNEEYTGPRLSCGCPEDCTGWDETECGCGHDLTNDPFADSPLHDATVESVEKRERDE